MACSPHNVPYAIWRHVVFSDIFLSRLQIQTARHQRRRFVSGARALRNRADSSSGDNRNNTTTTPSPLDEKENAVITNHGISRPSASLPQSPLVALAASHISGNKVPKNKGTKADHDRLKNNPWAVALASPVRYCSLTRMRMPEEFLTEMRLIRRVTASDEEASNSKSNKYGSLWWMPTKLVQKEIKASVHPHQGILNEFTSKGRPRVMRMLTRALAFDRLVEYFGKTGHQLRVKSKPLIPPDWKNSNAKLNRVDYNELIWRDDMASFVLKRMVKAIVEALQEACRYEKIKQGSADLWRELPLPDMTVSALIDSLRGVEMEDMKTGGVIILGDLAAAPSTEKNPRDALKYAFTSTFPDYITIPQTGTMAPVYDLSVVLSRSDLEALRQSNPRFNQRAVFLRPDGPKSTEAMLALWRLKGYIMHDVDFFSAEKADDTTIQESE